MAIESKDSAQMEGLIPIKKGTPHRKPLYNIKERILTYKSDSLRAIAHRQIKSLEKRLKYHPKMRSTYLEHINLIILDEKLFRTFSRIYRKERGYDNE